MSQEGHRPLKILHVYNHHRGGGGAEIAIRNTMAIQAEHGMDVEAFIRNSEDLPRGWSGRLQAGTSTFYNPASVREFGATLDRFQPDIVHAYDLFPLISPGIFRTCAENGVPALLHAMHYRLTCPITTHFRNGHVCEKCAGGQEYWAVVKNCRSNLAESLSLAFYGAKLRQFVKYLSGVIAPSDFTRRWLIERAGLDPTKVTTVTPAVDIPDYPSDPSQGTYVGFSGRFHPEKGTETVLAASGLCDVPFRFCRSENFLPFPLPKGADVFVTSTREGLLSFYRGARVLVFPSIWFETFGMTAAEAMAHGIPVVASRIGALSDLIEDGVDGLLFEPGNPRDLADKVKYLWSDPDLCVRLGRAGRRKVSAWSSAAFYRSINQVYREVCPCDSTAETGVPVSEV